MPNRLLHETSPYLRQHAENPVDWWPWSGEALALARRERKPILLSIGYAACHWCHVMAHESFEDAATARVMNALYVNIKVDREERPDIDKVYQLAHQALARRGGGWPLTVFLAPDDLVPFFAGTYFPKTPRYGQPAFVQVLEGVRAWFDAKPDEVRAQNDALAGFLADYGRGDAHAAPLDDAPIRFALARIAATFDRENGGHVGAPKFPHAGEIELLLRHAGDEELSPSPRAMAYLTLERMALRGLDDHLGGGFFRYCVDAQWEIPHFEKMLYDNAQLLPLYAEAAIVLDEPGFLHPADAVAGWVSREMGAPDGGFFSSLDADSEGEEGRYYVWQRHDVRALLDDDEFAIVQMRYGLDRPPNFEGHAWHLVVSAEFEEIGARVSLDPSDARRKLGDAIRKLFATRSRRERPGLDDKILTAWNALMIAGAARAALAHPERPLLAEAERALDFLYAKVWRDGRLFACHAGGVAKFPAYLDDHAFLLDALLAMLRVRWNRRDLDWAIALADTLLARFEDAASGGFFFTAHDAESLPQRPKPFIDESLPAGNGIAARALLRLGHLVGDARYPDAAERTLRAAWSTLAELPQACPALLLALGDFLAPTPHVVVRYRDESAVRDWRDALARARVEAYFVAADAPRLPGVLALQDTSAPVVAYLCRGTSCDPPLTSADAFAAALERLAD
jgi:uncharacterized protein YyaL (SSP411 family)